MAARFTLSDEGETAPDEPPTPPDEPEVNVLDGRRKRRRSRAMSKTVKVTLLVLAALGGSCLLCLVAAAFSDTPAGGSALDGRYGCFQSKGVTGANGQLQPRWTAVAVPGFRINGDTWSDASSSGSVSVAGNVVTFSGGSLDGWRGRIGADDKPFIAIGGDNHGEANDGTGNRWNDFKCFVQPD